MLNAFIKKIFGTKHERQMKRMQPLIDRINGLEAKMKGLPEADFPAITADLRARLAKGEPLDDLTARRSRRCERPRCVRWGCVTTTCR
jgi:preprotein translocase subunit SecA